jgi:CRP-like cAMP-binding protein
MDDENLKKLSDPYYEIPDNAWELFSEFLKPCSFKKNEIIKPPLKNESRLYLITKGSSGHFVYKDGHDICIDLCYEGDFTGDYYSLLLQTTPMTAKMQNSPVKNQISLSSPIYVMALEPIEAMALAKDDLFTLYKQPDHGMRIARMIAEVLYMQKQTQQIELLTLTAEQRYLRLLEKQPNILQRTANKHIASFLGIAPESFSRIRKKIVM